MGATAAVEGGDADALGEEKRPGEGDWVAAIVEDEDATGGEGEEELAVASEPASRDRGGEEDVAVRVGEEEGERASGEGATLEEEAAVAAEGDLAEVAGLRRAADEGGVVLPAEAGVRLLPADPAAVADARTERAGVLDGLPRGVDKTEGGEEGLCRGVAGALVAGVAPLALACRLR